MITKGKNNTLQVHLKAPGTPCYRTRVRMGIRHATPRITEQNPVNTEEKVFGTVKEIERYSVVLRDPIYPLSLMS
jgi:hypothetical protein